MAARLPSAPPTDAVGQAGPTPPLFRLVSIIFLLYIFLFSITLMGVAFKTFGHGFSEALITGTTNPVIGLMIGLLATSLIQSSSGTTSIVVGLVAVDALTVRSAIPIVMGANMGTTVTNTIVAMGSMSRRNEFKRAFAGATMHDFFNLLAILVLFPLEQVTRYLETTASKLSGLLLGAQGLDYESPIKTITKPVAKEFKHLLTDSFELNAHLAAAVMLVISLALLFGALGGFTKIMRQVVVGRAESALNTVLERSGVLGMLVGVLVTAIVQSSSITTSLLVPMIGAGIVQIEAAFAVTLGANVGTTVTALLASLTGNAAAVTVALVHLLFNLSGILIFYPVRFMRRIPIRLAEGLAERTSRNRMFALYYMLGLFFGLPLIFVMASKVLGGH